MKLGKCAKKLLSSVLAAAAAVSMTVIPSVSGVSAKNTVLPSAVDNSTGENGKYFPNIVDQGSFMSCVTHSTVYYQWTYTYNKAKGIVTSDKNSFSPGFVFKNNFESMKIQNVLSFLKYSGAATLEDAPFSGNVNDPLDKYSLYEHTNAAENALKARIGGFYFISKGKKELNLDGYFVGAAFENGYEITDPDDSDLLLIKQALADGEVLAFETNYDSIDTRHLTKSRVQIKRTSQNGYDNSFVGEWAIPYFKPAPDSSFYVGGHAMTIVGYNDNIWIDINENGVVDPHEKGALKIANSFGADEPDTNGGFFWVAYDALNIQSLVSDVDNTKRNYFSLNKLHGLIYDEAACEAPVVYVKTTLNTAHSRNAQINLKGTDNNGNEVVTFDLCRGYDSANIRNFAGGTGAIDGYLLNTLDNYRFNFADFEKYNWVYEVKNATSNSNYPLTVKDIKLIDQVNKKEYSMNSGKFTLAAGASKTVPVKIGSTPVPANTTTIYYNGYSTPYIHYMVEGGSWTAVPGCAMTPTNEVQGYTHKYIIDLGTATKATVCFNNGNGSWDSQNGANYTFAKGTYTYNASNHQIKTYSVTPTELTANIGLSASSVTQGETVSVTGSANGGSAPYTYKYSYTKNGSETVILNYSGSAKAAFTPSAVGTYTVKVTAKDSTGKTSTATKTLTVNEKKADGVVTIFYSGFSRPNIHYRAGSGTWTTPPGVAMQATSEVNGFTHKYTINIGKEDYAEVCFNDGYGSWDSNGGANYKFNRGTYTYKNHQIQRYTDIPTELTASLSLTSSKLTLGSNLSINASAFGGKAPYTYKFSYSVNGTTKTISNYSSNSVVSFKPDAVGTYSIKLDVKDSEGKISSTARDLVVEKKSANVVVVNYKGYNRPYIHYRVGNGSWTSVPGVPMSALSDGSGFTHRYIIELGNESEATACFNDGGNSWQNNGGRDFHFVKGTYSISNGVQTGYTSDVNIASSGAASAPLATINASTISLGNSIKLSANAGSDCKYAFYYKKTSKTNWTTKKSYSDTSSVSIKPAIAGSYDFCVKVMYSDGKVYKKYFTVNVTAPLENKSKLTLSDKKAVMKASSTGGTGEIMYAFFYKPADSSNWKTARNYSTKTLKSVNLTSGSYDFCVKARDENGKISKVYFTKTVA